ncbi:MAG: aldo/keto reductase [Myxococcaceae bacterium]|nr:aldo/keto reductase [Myxococcaceae bacterium]
MTTLKSRKLGSTGLMLSELTMGTWGLYAESYGRSFPEQQSATLARAIDQGITTFDMSPTWGDEGASESAVAAAVGDRREQMVYITRVGQVQGEGGVAHAMSAKELREQCEASLKRLATDRIDVLLLQHPSIDNHLRDDAVHGALQALKQEGKIRAFGASVSHVDDARAALVTGAEVLCVPFNMLQPDIVWDLASECHEKGVGILARSVLLHGLLSGKWSEKKRFALDDHRAHRWSHDAIAVRVRKALEYKNRISAEVPSMATLALQWVLSHDDITSAVFGPRTPAQVVAATDSLASQVALSPTDLQFHYNSIR